MEKKVGSSDKFDSKEFLRLVRKARADYKKEIDEIKRRFSRVERKVGIKN